MFVRNTGTCATVVKPEPEAHTVEPYSDGRRGFVAQFIPRLVTCITEAILIRSLNYWLMLTKKQFRERAIRELREIGKQVQALATDRALMRRLESDVIAANPELANSTSPYLLMLRGAYTDATTMRLRRLHAPDANISLRRLVAQISDYPEMLHEKLTSKELGGDLAEFDKQGQYLKQHIDPHFAAHERTPAALAAVNRELDRAIDHLADCVKRYYWIVADAYIDVEPSVADGALSVFHFAWIEAK